MSFRKRLEYTHDAIGSSLTLDHRTGSIHGGEVGGGGREGREGAGKDTVREEKETGKRRQRVGG